MRNKNCRLRQIPTFCGGTKRSRKVIVFVCVMLCLSKPKGRPYSVLFRESIDMCSHFARPVEINETGTSRLPATVLEMLLEIDHVYVLTFDVCTTNFPRSFSRHATCLFGKRIDSCVPKPFIAGMHAHGMKVSFMHAVAIELARRADHRHIAIIEDDALFRPRAFSSDSVLGFRRLLHSDSWSLIRFGFRPFFLEETSRDHCPNKCVCRIDAGFVDDFCQLFHAGCDIRSSDFYIIRREYFVTLQSSILNVGWLNFDRIVDTRPMRQLKNQWLAIPQVSLQSKLDLPVDYQLGLGALYVKKCVKPRPLSWLVTQQLFNTSNRCS